MDLKRLKEAAVPLRHLLGALSIDQVNEAVIKRYRNDRGVSPGTLQREENALKAALNLAGHPVKWPPPQGQAVRERFLTPEQGRRLIDGAREPHVRLFILLALMTGARKQAILNLIWFRAPRLDFNVPGRAQTKKRRGIVPFGPKVAAELKVARQRVQTEWVIEYQGKRATMLRGGFRAAVKRAGLEVEVTRMF